MVGSIAIDYVESGRHFLLGMVPVIAAMSAGFFLRKYFTGKKWDGVQKTLAILVLVVAVVSATSFFTMNRMMDRQDNDLPPGQVALTVQDLAPGKTLDYQSYNSSSSVLVPEYYRYHESLSGEIAVNTEVAKTRSEKMAAYLYTLHQEEMDKFNYQVTFATDHFPDYDEAIYAIPIFFIHDDPIEGNTREGLGDISRGGTLLVREGFNVIRLSIDKDLNDPEIRALLAKTIEEAK